MNEMRHHSVFTLAALFIAFIACGTSDGASNGSTSSSSGSSSSGGASSSGSASSGSSSGNTDDGGVDGSTGDPDASTSTFTCPTTRATTDAADDVAGYKVHVMYVVPSDGADDALDTNGKICNSVINFTSWMKKETAGRSLRLDTKQGALDIQFVRLTKTDAQMKGTANVSDVDTGFAFLRDRIERELKDAGLVAAQKLYAVYYGGSTTWSCGGAAYPPSLVGQVGALYLNGAPAGAPACNTNVLGKVGGPPGYLDYAILHELVHTLGFVASGATHHHSAGHVADGVATQARDLMYAPRPSTSDPGWGTNDPGGLVLDIGKDDYFEHGQAGLLDLAKSAFIEPLPAGALPPPGW
jgi:hypothetical protein